MKRLTLFIELFFFCAIVQAQPFVREITSFQRQDSLAFPVPNQILFVGSSSFTNWKDVKDYFPGYKILNRGFGGSSLTDVVYYAEKIIFPYKPKQIVIYCGENDIAGDTTITGKIVFDRFVELYHSIRKNLGKIPVAYISMKPSPSRWFLKGKFEEGNNEIKKFLKKRKRNSAFIDVWDAMLDAHKQPNKALFLADDLHMNKSGYEIWQKIIQPFLIK